MLCFTVPTYLTYLTVRYWPTPLSFRSVPWDKVQYLPYLGGGCRRPVPGCISGGCISGGPLAEAEAQGQWRARGS